MKALAIVAIVGLAAMAHAQEAPSDTVAYHVKQGDTLDLIAAEFYGDHARTAVFVAEENKLPRPYRVFPGERLRIPINREIATAKGDSFASLATQYLGDANRAPFLAQFNHMAPTDDLPTGTTLAIPFHVVHVAPSAESLAQVAAMFFGDSKQAEAIKAYNGLDKTSLDKGESILVPVLHLRARPEHTPTIDAEAAQRRDLQKRVTADAQAALPVARTAWREGDFAQVKDALGPIAKQLDYLNAASATEIGLLLGKAYVAYEDKPAALALFQQVLARAPQHTLSAYAESPKVLEAWHQAGGRIQ